jgi:hypothetical protein
VTPGERAPQRVRRATRIRFGPLSVRRRTWRRAKKFSALLIGALLVAVIVTAWQVWHVRGEMRQVAVQLTAMTDAVADGNAEAARGHLDSARDSADSARFNTRGPVWWTASKLPWVGDDVTAIRTVTDVSADLTDDALTDLVAAGARLSGSALQPHDGRIDLQPIAEVAPRLARGAVGVRENAQRVSDLDTSGLIGPLKAPVVDLQDKLETASRMSSSAATAAKMLPPMMGQDGTRTYLVLFQNNAEVRATGGMPGAMALMTANHGKLTLVRTVLPRDISGAYFDAPVESLSQSETALFTDRVAQYPQDTGINPDFPRAAQVLATMWKHDTGQTLDGVMTVDPVVLAGILKATGPIAVDGRSLTAGNAVDTLLRDAYLEIPTDEQQNALFTGTMRGMLDKILNGEFDPATLVRALDEGVTQRRVFVWSAHAEDQKTFAPLRIGGSVFSRASKAPQVGMYLNDSASDKLTYYLDHDISVQPRSCGSTGMQVLDVRMVLKSHVPEGDLPLSVVGANPASDEPGLKPGDMRITSYMYAPVKGRIDSATLDGKPIQWFETVQKGREVGALTTDIARGAKHVIEYTVYTGEGQTGDPDVQTTPGVRSDGIGTVGKSACA